jgi:tetratricopeptide (TPR) repeat protein
MFAMTAKTPAQPADHKEAPTSLVGRVRALCAKPLSLFAARPLWQKGVISTVVVAVIGIVGWFSLGGSEEPEEEAAHTLPDALYFLKEKDFVSARIIVEELKEKDRLSYDDRGGPPYVYGMIAAAEAEEIPYAEEQRRMYLIAARYLDAASHDEYPAAISTEGLVRLGECWHNAGRYARALPYLTQALKRRPRNAARVHQLLAACYYRDANPQLKPALEHLQKYLADRMLTPEQRQAGLVEQARILVDLGQVADAEKLLAEIPAKSTSAAVVNLLKARLVMRRAGELAAEAAADTAKAEEAKKLWSEATELLRTPAGRDPASAQAHRESQYLLGICYLKLDDYRAAENQFSRTRRINVGLPEGLAAAMEEADLERLQGKDEGAIELYAELLRDLGDLRDYSNPLLPAEKLQERLLAAYRHYRDAEKYEVALKFLKSLTPILSAQRVLELEAEINRRWADRLSAQISGADDARAMVLESQAHVRYHLAAELYYRLARSSRESKLYPEYLWQSADSYRLAHDYHRTARVMRMYLDENQPQRRADALLAVGEAELALNNLETSLSVLRELLRDDAKHPLSYRARIVMHDVYVEQGKFAEARQKLIDNLEHEALTPQSIEWRDSLFALAQMLYRQGLVLETTSREQGIDGETDEGRKTGLKSLEQASNVFREAILKYTEALARYPDAPQTFEARYLAAECHRQAAKWPRKKMPTVSIETTRAALTRQMHEDLAAAHKLYNELIHDLNERQDAKPLNGRERDLLRNSYFLQADTLFDLGKYTEAIHAYSSATNRYQQRPEALEAFVQIASCYRQLNEPTKARGTLEQAKVVLKRIPLDAKFDTTTRYSRDEWVTLLDFLSAM